MFVIRRLPPRYAAFVMPLILSVLMTFVVSAISTLKSLGPTSTFLLTWPSAWALSWLVAFPTLLVVLPLVRRLVTLVVDETPPLKRYGSFDYDAIMLQMARIPREKLGTALDEAQWRELKLRFDQARRMESILVSEGYVSGPERPTGATTHAPPGSTRPDNEAILIRTGRGGSR